MNASTSIRRQLEAGPWVAGAARVTLCDVEVAIVHRYPYGCEVVMDGEAVGGARGLNCALDTVACRLIERDPRTEAERQADEDWLDWQDTIACARPH